MFVFRSFYGNLIANTNNILLYIDVSNEKKNIPIKTILNRRKKAIRLPIIESFFGN